VAYLIILVSDIVILALMGEEVRLIAAPALAAVSIVVGLWCLLRNRDGVSPFLDAGFFCALATLVYTVYPLISFWIGDLSFGIFSDARLIGMNLSAAEVGAFHWRHVLYLFCFSTVYCGVRGRTPIGVGDVEIPDRQVVRFLLILFIVFYCYFFVLEALTGASFDAGYSELGSVYETRSRLPLLVAQISGKLFSLLFVVKLALLYVVVTRCDSRRWKVILCIWVLLEIVHTVLVKGARTSLVLFIFATALFYHRIIKRLNMTVVFSCGVLILAFFVLFGIFRGAQNLEDMVYTLDFDDNAFSNALKSSNEFESLLGTAYDVLLMKQAGTEFPWYLHLNDFMTILPPQQIVPFEKVVASEWYLRTLGLSGTGEGIMWGVISQSIIGFDWFELAARGAVLGFILALLYRWYARNSRGFLANLFYVFLCLRVYYTFRDTTFSPLAELLWVVLPFLILFKYGPGLMPISQTEGAGSGS